MTIDRRRLLAFTGGAALDAATGLATPIGVVEGQTALAASAALLFGLIDENRDLGRPGARPFFVLDSGLAYVQALAGEGGSPIRLEAVSAKSVPAMADFLSPDKLRRLSALGFHAPAEGQSPNYWQDVETDKPRDLKAAGALAATVLAEVYNVESADAVEALIRIPQLRSYRIRLREDFSA